MEHEERCSCCGNEKENEFEELCRDCAWWTAGDRKMDEDGDR